MRRSLPTLLVVVVGLLLLVDFVLINPTVAGLASGVLELIVLLAAAAALAGAATLVLRHWTDLTERRRDPLGSGVLLAGFAVMLLAGFYPGSTGASDPAVRWLVAALLAPLLAALFALLFVFLLTAARRGLDAADAPDRGHARRRDGGDRPAAADRRDRRRHVGGAVGLGDRRADWRACSGAC